MARFYVKILLFGLLVCFCIFFGVDLASRGVERIQGPVSDIAAAPARAASASAVPKPLPAGTVVIDAGDTRSTAQTARPAPSAPAPATSDSSLNFVGNKLGDLLQIAAHHGIRWFVSLFQAIVG
jgi:hypothetical protein